MKSRVFAFTALLLLALGTAEGYAAKKVADVAMQNVMGRDRQSLNGEWSYILDINDLGRSQRWFKMRDFSDPTKLDEICFDGGQKLRVPGDWNSQYPELLYYESTMWYQRWFDYNGAEAGSRQFLHFGAVANDAEVYLNGKLLGSHYGGFTPFQFDVTDVLRTGPNMVVVRVNNARSDSSLPGMIYDWWNYGGITRDVDIVTTPATYIEDYWVRLDKGSMSKVVADVQLNGAGSANSEVVVSIEGTKIAKRAVTDANGRASVSFDAKLELWSPENPKLYNVVVKSANDRVEDQIGFRCFEVRGTKLYLNGESIFLKGINLHEEVPHERRRAISVADAEYLLSAPLELGCNFIRHTHYSPNEYMIRMCDQKGLMMWEEIPTWGSHLDFSNALLCARATQMMEEMIRRDKNRCGTIIWSVANETKPKDKHRIEFLTGLMNKCREWDNTRAISLASNASKYFDDPTKLVLDDPLADEVDIIAVNKYVGWYLNWAAAPEKTQWITRDNKPMIVSEFGAGGVYGNNEDPNSKNTFSEGYMARVYEESLKFYEQVPNLCGTVPWLMFDFRSTRRAHLRLQDGWNRKGLLSPYGEKKQAWYVMKRFYDTK